MINALGLKAAAGQSLDNLVTLQEIPFQADPIVDQVASIQSETRVQSWLEAGARYFAVGAALIVFLVFWRMLSKQKPEPVPVELLTAAPVNTHNNGLSLNGGSLTPELLNELIKQKPVNVSNALRDWVNVKKS